MGAEIILFTVFYCVLMWVVDAGPNGVSWSWLTNALALGVYMLFRRSDFLPFTSR